MQTKWVTLANDAWNIELILFQINNTLPASMTVCACVCYREWRTVVWRWEDTLRNNERLHKIFTTEAGQIACTFS